MEIESGKKCRIKDEYNSFDVYRVGGHSVEVLYHPPDNPEVLRILYLPKAILEMVKEKKKGKKFDLEKMTEEQWKEVMKVYMARIRKGERGISKDKIAEELFGEG